MIPLHQFRHKLLCILWIAVLVTASFRPVKAYDTHPSPRQAPQSPDLAADWPQAGRDPQHTNSSPVQVDPPYCYAWKWYEAPFASRAQPVVAGGRLFIGGMDGRMYARDATTGAPLWNFWTGGPIRNTAAVANDRVIFSSYDGYTYSLKADGSDRAAPQKTLTGPSATAPLWDPVSGRVYVASTNGKISALNSADLSLLWQVDTGAAILTSPTLSVDGQTVFLGNESIQALALNASTGSLRWKTALQGQSLAERYPVVIGDAVIYRSQPVYFFHTLLHEGDSVMDQAGVRQSGWAADWTNVRPQIMNYLNSQPTKQTFFVLDSATGASRGTAPVLYTYGNNDIPNLPVVINGNVYVTYRARHGIQTDSPSDVHVTSKYDAELGQMNLASLDISGLQANSTFNYQFRLTSDEPAMLSSSGNILLVDNWERLGGVNVSTGALVYVGNVSNDWPECGAQCGPAAANPFFPMSGSGAAYPFPAMRSEEGRVRGGVVVANNMLYWRVIEGGLAGISHQSGSSCPTPRVWAPGTPLASQIVPTVNTTHAYGEYVNLDLSTPSSNPPADLVDRLHGEVSKLIASNGHLMPIYIDRGFTEHFVWPYRTSNPPGLPAVGDGSTGNVYWQDPGDLLIALGMAYPYLDATLQAQMKSYMASQMSLFPPLSNLPFNGAGTQDWLRQGVARESYPVPFRSTLNNWPPVAASANALYGLWLWSKNTGDWSYAQSHYANAKSLYNAIQADVHYLSDIGGMIGFARIAQHLGNNSDYQAASQAVVAAMQYGAANLNTYLTRADSEYLDPREQKTGWYAPALYGLTPEVGLYLREHTNGAAISYLFSKEDGNGLRWWYLTRAGVHAEIGESSYITPIASWSHFMAHAYLVGDQREALTGWLDRPWATGDLYSIEKTVAAIEAAPLAPDFAKTRKFGSLPTPKTGEEVTLTISLQNAGLITDEKILLTDVVPAGLSYIPGSINATSGEVDLTSLPTLKWSGVMPPGGLVTITYRVSVIETAARRITAPVHIDAGSGGAFDREVSFIVNGVTDFLPFIQQGSG